MERTGLWYIILWNYRELERMYKAMEDFVIRISWMGMKRKSKTEAKYITLPQYIVTRI
jgi:hypothetical protein